MKIVVLTMQPQFVIIHHFVPLHQTHRFPFPVQSAVSVGIGLEVANRILPL